ncbi:peptidase [uncultured archaeon]|nr:peptidase [uncultured archaeon]HKJ96896.1 site-2 protease family protein [Thermoplasmataceae archaeon]
MTAEVKDIGVSVVVLTAAFTLLLYRYNKEAFGGSVGVIAIASFLIVLTAFLMHEMAHRFVARSFGGIAFFKMWLPGILLILVTSIFGIIFAAPGAVNIGGIFRKDQIGKTALAGPATNLGIGILLYAALFFVPLTSSTMIVYSVMYWMAGLNLWFALFNLIPIPPFDGQKIYKWDLHIYIVIVAVALVMNFLNGPFL